VDGVNDINFKDIDGKLVSYISEGPNISVTLANLGLGLHQIFVMYPQFFEGCADDTVLFIEEHRFIYIYYYSKNCYRFLFILPSVLH
jgi:hypothetical protein